jgi:ABC-type cobalamin transport system ATPase subunit
MSQPYIPPALGTVQAFIMQTQEPTVQVQVFKFDTIRQEAYWVTKEVRKFKTRQQAEAYIQRVSQ